MSARDLEQGNGRALVGLVESIRKLSTAPKATVPLVTRREATRRLGISARELRIRIRSGELDTAKVGRRVLIFL